MTFHDRLGLLEIEYARRTGYFTMESDHFHEHFELYYLISGERFYFIKERAYRIVPGDLVLINRNAVHKTSDAGIPDHERIVIYLHRKLLETLYPEWLKVLEKPFTWDDPILRLSPHDSMYIVNLMAEMKRELELTQTESALLLQHRVIDLLLYAHRQQQNRISLSLQMDTPIGRKITDVVRYLNEHFSESLPLSEIASLFYISPFYLSRIFKETTGFSYTYYLNLTRIKEAQRLLRETDLSISEIAWRSGFENFSHFGKMFKKTSHLSPRDYRRQHRLSEPI
ncbi:AraC-like DNA-binding protein [Paenibacillus sp. DS2015]